MGRWAHPNHAIPSHCRGCGGICIPIVGGVGGSVLWRSHSRRLDQLRNMRVKHEDLSILASILNTPGTRFRLYSYFAGGKLRRGEYRAQFRINSMFSTPLAKEIHEIPRNSLENRRCDHLCHFWPFRLPVCS